MVSHRKTVIVHWKLVQTPIFSTACIVRRDLCQLHLIQGLALPPDDRICRVDWIRCSWVHNRSSWPDSWVENRRGVRHSTLSSDVRTPASSTPLPSGLCAVHLLRRETVRVGAGRGRGDQRVRRQGGGGGWVNAGVTWRNSPSNALYGLKTWHNCEWNSYDVRVGR